MIEAQSVHSSLDCSFYSNIFFQLVCATENFTNRYTSLNLSKSVAFSSLYHYR